MGRSIRRLRGFKGILEDARKDFNPSTNRLLRQSDPTDERTETRNTIHPVKRDGLHVNQTMNRGKYNTQANRYQQVLDASISDLTRCYGPRPMPVP